MLDIIYHDENLIAINKPEGLLVHRTNLDPSEKTFAMLMLRDQIDCWVYPVHRLDKGTSGVLLFGKSQESASKMGEIVLKGAYKKKYLAIVRGYSPDDVTIDYPVPQGRKETRKNAVTRIESIGKTEINHAVGKFDTARYSLVNAFPQTGRRHQIRRHLKHIFYPIIGDRRYGDRAHNRFFREELELPQMFLHSSELEFNHPYSEKNIVIKAELPEYWVKALELFPTKLTLLNTPTLKH